MRHLALALFVSCLALAGCRPSKKEVDALSTRVVHMKAKQEELDERVAELEEEQRQLSDALDRTENERKHAQDMADDYTSRLAELEEKKEKRVRPGRPDPSRRYRVPIREAHSRGTKSALVTIVEFADYQCPYCKRVEATLTQIERKYAGKVRIVFMHNPLAFHKRALPAALAAEAAGRQGKFWKMHARLFDDNRDLTDSNFVKWAKRLRLDIRRFKRDLKDPALEALIQGHLARAAKVGARGTPSFFINGRFLSGAQPLDNFVKLIDEELAHAEKLVREGVPKARIYDVLMDGALPGVD